MHAIVIALIMLAVSMLLSMMLMKPNKVKPASLDDFDFPLKEDGTPQTVVFGDVWLTGPMVCWYGNYRTKKIKASAK